MRDTAATPHGGLTETGAGIARTLLLPGLLVGARDFALALGASRARTHRVANRGHRVLDGLRALVKDELGLVDVDINLLHDYLAPFFALSAIALFLRDLRTITVPLRAPGTEPLTRIALSSGRI